MAYRLIAFDMDGTLLDSSKRLAADSVAALERAVAAGAYVVLATGRGISELDEYLDVVPGLRYLVCISGALVYDVARSEAIARTSLPDDVVGRLFEIARHEDVMVHMLSESSYVQTDAPAHMERYQMGIYRPMFERVCVTFDDLEAAWRERRFSVEKVNLYHTDAQSRERTRGRLVKADLGVEMVYAEQTSIEVSPRGVTKGTGLRSLCEHLGLSSDEVVAVGDAANDIEMLRAVGMPVAMGNALPEVKAIAREVVADNDHGGCAEAIDRILLA